MADTKATHEFLEELRAHLEGDFRKLMNELGGSVRLLVSEELVRFLRDWRTLTNDPTPTPLQSAAAHHDDPTHPQLPCQMPAAHHDDPTHPQLPCQMPAVPSGPPPALPHSLLHSDDTQSRSSKVEPRRTLISQSTMKSHHSNSSQLSNTLKSHAGVTEIPKDPSLGLLYHGRRRFIASKAPLHEEDYNTPTISEFFRMRRHSLGTQATHECSEERHSGRQRKNSKQMALNHSLKTDASCYVTETGTEAMGHARAGSKDPPQKAHTKAKLLSAETIKLARESVRFEKLHPNGRRSLYQSDDGDGNRRRELVRGFVDSPLFDTSVGIILTLNAISIGIQADYLARTLEDPPIGLRVIEWIFCAVFVTELSLRLFAYRWAYFCMPGRGWNIFDFSLVFLQVTEESVSIMIGSSSNASSSTTVFRIVRMVRLVRVLRFARILHLVHELQALVNSIIAAMKTFLWTTVLLFMLIFLFGVCITQIVADARRGADASDFHYWETLDKYYGNLLVTLLTLFQSMSGGVDWDDASRPLTTDVSPLMALIFCLYISLSLLIMTNLVTGVFVARAWVNLEESKQEHLVNNIRQLFLSGDKDHTGSISWEEFHGQLQNPLMEEFFRQIDLDPAQAKDFYDWLDNDGQNEVFLDDFVMGCLRMFGWAKSLDLAMLTDLSKKTASQVESMTINIRQVMTSMQNAGMIIQRPSTLRSPHLLDGERISEASRASKVSSAQLGEYPSQKYIEYSSQTIPAQSTSSTLKRSSEDERVVELNAPSPMIVPPPGFIDGSQPPSPNLIEASPRLAASTVGNGEFFSFDTTKVWSTRSSLASKSPTILEDFTQNPTTYACDPT